MRRRETRGSVAVPPQREQVSRHAGGEGNVPFAVLALEPLALAHIKLFAHPHLWMLAEVKVFPSQPDRLADRQARMSEEHAEQSQLAHPSGPWRKLFAGSLVQSWLSRSNCFWAALTALLAALRLVSSGIRSERTCGPVRNAFSVLAHVPISQKDATRFSFERRRRCRGFPVARSGRRIRLHLEASRRSCCSSTVGRRASDTTGRDAFFCCAQSRCATDGLPASSVGFGSSFRVVVLLGFRVVGGKGVSA